MLNTVAHTALSHLSRSGMGNLLSEEESRIIKPHVDGFDPSSLATVIWDAIREIGQDDKHDNFGIHFSKPDKGHGNSHHPMVTFWDGNSVDQLPRYEFLRVLEYIAESTLKSYAEIYDLKRSPEIGAKTVRLERALDGLKKELQQSTAGIEQVSDQLLCGVNEADGGSPSVLSTLSVPGSPNQNIVDTIRAHRVSCTWIPPVDNETTDDLDEDKNCIFTIPEEDEEGDVFSLSSVSSFGNRLTERRRSSGSMRVRHLSDGSGRFLSDGSGWRPSDGSGQHLSDGDGSGHCSSSESGQHYSAQHLSGDSGGDVGHYSKECLSDGGADQCHDDHGQRINDRERRYSDGGNCPRSKRFYSSDTAHHSIGDMRQLGQLRPVLQRGRRVPDEDDMRIRYMPASYSTSAMQLSAKKGTLTRKDTACSYSSEPSSFEDDDVFQPLSPPVRERRRSTTGRGMEAVIERLPELRERYERTLAEDRPSNKVRKLRYKLHSLASFKSLSGDAGTEA